MLTLIVISVGAFITTLLGGFFALKFQDKLHLILGFSAGAVIGVALFDLLPESIELVGETVDVGIVTGLVALGFFVFMIIDRFIAPHHHMDEPCGNCAHHNHGKKGGHSHAVRGRLGAGSLSIHSFIDGLAVGLAFQVSAAVGFVVAVAVLVHDFSDGINTVSLILKNGGSHTEALRWLAVDSIAPVIGIFVGSFFILPEAILGFVLAIFCGFFIYIGASDLLPESHHGHPALWTTLMTLAGAIVLYIAITIAHVAH